MLCLKFKIITDFGSASVSRLVQSKSLSMISVEDPEEGEEMPQGTGVWKGRLRKRPQKEIVPENPSESKKSKVEESLHNNNNLIPAEVKKPIKNRPKPKLQPSKGKIGQGKENMSMSIVQNFHPNPKTIKQRMENQSLMKAYNRDYQDDIFDSGIMQPAKLNLRLDIEDSDSDSFSSSSDSGSCLARSPRSSPFSRLKREDTPVWYKNFMQEKQANLKEVNSYKHVAFVHKSLKNQKKVQSAKRISTQVPVGPGSGRMMKESLEASSKEIALSSYSRAENEEEDSEQCEEYFSEED